MEILMKRTVVIYESKYGSTRKYAEWIADALSCSFFEKDIFKPEDFSNYDVVIYGGGLYAGGVSGIKLLTKNWNLLRDRHVILFTCGLADPEDPENIAHIRDSLSKVLSPEMLEHIHLFHLRGGIDYGKLNFVHKSMMAMLRKSLQRKDQDSLREEDRQLLATYGGCVDFTSKESIAPIVKEVLSL